MHEWAGPRTRRKSPIQAYKTCGTSWRSFVFVEGGAGISDLGVPSEAPAVGRGQSLHAAVDFRRGLPDGCDPCVRANCHQVPSHRDPSREKYIMSVKSTRSICSVPLERRFNTSYLLNVDSILPWVGVLLRFLFSFIWAMVGCRHCSTGSGKAVIR